VSKTASLPPVQTHIVLSRGEVAIRQEATQLHEARAVRLYGGIGTRIGRIHVGGGRSTSYQRLQPIDTGILLLTNQRLVFDGQKENRILKANEIVSVQSSVDAIEVSSSRRQKSQVYTVGNPRIWATLLQSVVSGQGDTLRAAIEKGVAKSSEAP
jgi:hypothetical protein